MKKQIACFNIFHSQSNNSKVYYAIFAKCPSGFFGQPDNQHDQRQQQNQHRDYGISFRNKLKTIKRRIKSMPNIYYVGRGSNGHWEIEE